MAARSGSATWSRDLLAGSGEVTVGEHVWTAPYSGSRFHDVMPGFQPSAQANPEELLAAAHAACFNTALSLHLTQTGFVPRLLTTRARVHLRNIDGGPRIDEIDIETEGDVPRVDDDGFREQAELAKVRCIISRPLGGVAQINLVGKLASEPH